MKTIVGLLFLILSFKCMNASDCYFLQNGSKTNCTYLEIYGDGAHESEFFSMNYCTADGNVKTIINLRKSGVTETLNEGRKLVYLDKSFNGFAERDNSFFFEFSSGPYLLYREIQGTDLPHHLLQNYPSSNKINNPTTSTLRYVVKTPDGAYIPLRNNKDLISQLKPTLEKITGFKAAFKNLEYRLAILPTIIQLANSYINNVKNKLNFFVKATGDTIYCRALYFNRNDHTIDELIYWDWDGNYSIMSGKNSVSDNVLSIRFCGYYLDKIPNKQKGMPGDTYCYRCVDGKIKEYILQVPQGRFQNVVIIASDEPIELKGMSLSYKEYKKNVVPKLVDCGFNLPTDDAIEKIKAKSSAVNAIYNSACQ